MYDRTEKAIDIYEEAVGTAVGNLKRNFLVNILYIVVTLILIIAAAVWANLGGLVTTLGLGGVTAASQGKAWIETFRGYSNDATKLKLSVSNLRSKLSMCSKDDQSCLDEVSSLINKAFDALSSAAAK